MSDNPSPYFISTRRGPFVFECQGYATEADYDFVAGYVGAMREDAHRWHFHRNTAELVDEELIPICEALSGIKRAVDKKASKAHKDTLVNKENAKPILESATRYYARLERDCDPAILDELRVRALALSRTFFIGVRPVERKKNIEPVYYRRADSWLEVLSTENLNDKVAALLPKVPGFRPELNGDDRIARDSLARLLQKVDENELAMQD